MYTEQHCVRLQLGKARTMAKAKIWFKKYNNNNNKFVKALCTFARPLNALHSLLYVLRGSSEVSGKSMEEHQLPGLVATTNMEQIKLAVTWVCHYLCLCSILHYTLSLLKHTHLQRKTCMAMAEEIIMAPMALYD